jgi:CRISPR/Cas system-associated exonuclease Cas4 (RecB family)
VVRHQLERRKEGRADIASYLTLLALRELSGDAAADTILDHQLANDTIARVTLSARQEARLREQVQEALAGIARGEFPARPDPRQCGACEFALICPA